MHQGGHPSRWRHSHRVVLYWGRGWGLCFLLAPSAATISVQHRQLLWSLLPATGLVFITGVIDDIFGLKPWQKLAGQTASRHPGDLARRPPREHSRSADLHLALGPASASCGCSPAPTPSTLSTGMDRPRLRGWPARYSGHAARRHLQPQPRPGDGDCAFGRRACSHSLFYNFNPALYSFSATAAA